MHEGDSFTILLTDLNNTSISNQVVNVSIIDANGGQNNQSVTTDADGRGNLQLNGLTEVNIRLMLFMGAMKITLPLMLVK